MLQPSLASSSSLLLKSYEEPHLRGTSSLSVTQDGCYREYPHMMMCGLSDSIKIIYMFGWLGKVTRVKSPLFETDLAT